RSEKCDCARETVEALATKQQGDANREIKSRMAGFDRRDVGRHMKLKLTQRIPRLRFAPLGMTEPSVRRRPRRFLKESGHSRLRRAVSSRPHSPAITTACSKAVE